jgi:branched-chain amino acid transport system substrate-binding protein
VVFDGVTAKIAFDEKGDLKGGAVTMYQVRQGKWQVVETIGGVAPVAK